MVKKERDAETYACPDCQQPVAAEVTRHKTLGIFVPEWGPGPCHNPDCPEHIPKRRHRGDSADLPPRLSEDEADYVQLTAVVRDWAAAIVSNDAARMASFMAEDWVIVSESGISTKEQFLAFVESGALTHSAMDLISPPRVRVHGDTAVFTARATNTAHYGGRRFDADEWTTDVFVRRDGSWLCVLSHITAAAPSPT